MAKATIKIKAADAKKLIVAASVNSIKITGSKKIADENIVELDFRNPKDLFEAGRLIDRVTGSEYDEQPQVEPKTTAKKAA